MYIGMFSGVIELMCLLESLLHKIGNFSQTVMFASDVCLSIYGTALKLGIGKLFVLVNKKTTSQCMHFLRILWFMRWHCNNALILP